MLARGIVRAVKSYEEPLTASPVATASWSDCRSTISFVTSKEAKTVGCRGHFVVEDVAAGLPETRIRLCFVQHFERVC